MLFITSVSLGSAIWRHPLFSHHSSITRRPLRPPTVAVLHPAPPADAARPRKPKPKPGQPGHRFYEYNPEDIAAVRIRHILVDTQELCDSLHASIVSDRLQLSTLAKSLSICKATRDRGGDIGWWYVDDLVPREVPSAIVDDAVLTAALSARANTLVRVQSLHGWHLFVVEDARHKLRTTHCRTPLRHNPNSQSLKKAALSGEDEPPVPRTYALQTLGCQMNRSDSERMAGVLEHIGYKPIEDPFRASLLVLNTCNIREHAEKKVYSYLGRHTSRKRQYPHEVTLAVAGCVAQQEGERMLRRVPELDMVFGPQYANRLDELLDDVKRNGCQVAATDPVPIVEDIAKPRRESTVTAWINVIFGCGQNCTFCTVGNVVRPVEQSRTMEAIRSEIEAVAESGIREIVLLGQNIDAYGRDMYPKRTFADLLQFIHDVKGIERIRFTTSHPRYISEELVMTCAILPKVMPFFHIPPQHGDNDILREMRRGYTVEGFEKVVARIRKHIPDAAICGDLIVGFPGETEEQLQRSMEMMERVKFDVMNTAAYSPRPKTPAAEMEGQIDEEVKHERLLRVNRVVTEHALERSLRYVGRTEEVLVEEVNGRNAAQVIGRTQTNRAVYFEGNIEELRNKLVDVEIEKAFPFSLQGTQVGSPR